MVNLKKDEILQLQNLNKLTPSCKTEENVNSIFVTLNCSYKKLSPFLKYKAKQLNQIQDKFWSGNPYSNRFLFEITNYQPYNLFGNEVQLTLCNARYFPMSGINVSYFDDYQGVFNIPVTDLDKYFKRFYPEQYYIELTNLHLYSDNRNNTGNIHYSSYTNEDDIKFTVIENLYRKTILVKNITPLIENNSKTFTGIAFCHDNDEYNFKTGLEIALQKWRNEWVSWFEKTVGISKNSANKSENNKNKTSEVEKESNDMKTIKLTNKDTNEVTEVPIIEVSNNECADLDTQNISIRDICNDDAVGLLLGDYIVKSIDRDNSRHVIWTLECSKHNHIVKTTRSNLIKGKTNLVCPLCENDRINQYIDRLEQENKIVIKNFETQEINDNYCADYLNDIDSNCRKDDCNEDENCNNCEDCFEKNNVILQEEEMDLFDTPVYAVIAYCVSPDLEFHGPICEKIQQIYNMREKFQDFKERTGREVLPGDSFQFMNVITLIASPGKHQKATMEIMKDCISNLANTCYENDIPYLYIPKLGCGANGLVWHKVRELIIKEFNKKYNNSDKKIEITACLGKSY